MLKSIEIPKYLDVLLIIDDGVTRAKIYRVLNRGKDYLSNALIYLEEKGLILIRKGEQQGKYIKDKKILQITLTPKGKDVQNIIISLYNIMGLKK